MPDISPQPYYNYTKEAFMSGHLPRTNRWLILLSIVLCLIFGGIFTRSSAGPSQVSADSDAGVFLYQKIRILRSFLLKEQWLIIMKILQIFLPIVPMIFHLTVQIMLRQKIQPTMHPKHYLNLQKKNLAKAHRKTLQRVLPRLHQAVLH